MDSELLTIRGLNVTAVSVPMKRPLVTSVQTIAAAPMLLIDVQTREGVTGHAYVFCYLRRLAVAVKAALDEIAEVSVGEPLAPRNLSLVLNQHFRLVGATGLVNTALAAFDMACWDATARALGVPLVTLLGGSRRLIQAYNSSGLGMSAPDTLAAEAVELLAGGFKGVKIRLGRADPDADLHAVRAVRRELPDNVVLMADYNQALGRAEALARCKALDDEGLYWIEEPVRHDDYSGCAELAGQIRTPIQIGENFVGPRAMSLALAAKSSDFCMPDVERIGGVTGWMDAAALAAIHGIPISSHLMPEVSAHLLAASPTRHWLEYVDWADAILREPLEVLDGHVQIPNRPGSGIDWDASSVRRFRIE